VGPNFELTTPAKPKRCEFTTPTKPLFFELTRVFVSFAKAFSMFFLWFWWFRETSPLDPEVSRNHLGFVKPSRKRKKKGKKIKKNTVETPSKTVRKMVLEIDSLLDQKTCGSSFPSQKRVLGSSYFSFFYSHIDSSHWNAVTKAGERCIFGCLLTFFKFFEFFPNFFEKQLLWFFIRVWGFINKALKAEVEGWIR
jgi:HAMP domain-containing protein